MQLTKEQEARSPEYTDRWVKIGLSCAPLDKKEVEEAVALAYRCADVPVPSRIEYAAGPIDGLRIACRLHGLEATPANMSKCLNEIHWNNHNVGYLSFYEFAREVGGMKAETESMAGLLACARAFGWWAPYDDAVVIHERPLHISLDDRGRLHNVNTAALEYRDGTKLYAWQGTIVPADVILRPDELTVKRIDDETNAEVRRVMLTRFGLARFVRESGAVVVDECPADHHIAGLRTARLLRREFGAGRDADEPLQMLDLLNSTPEPDGTVKRYMIRVPPTVRSCLGGEAWIAGLDRPEQYKPVLET